MVYIFVDNYYDNKRLLFFYVFTDYQQYKNQANSYKQQPFDFYESNL